MIKSMNQEHDYLPELETAIAAARAAGTYIRGQWDSDIEMEYKGEVDLVSLVDRHAEALILERISATYPQDRIIAEETGSVGEITERVWYVDPLDGTTNFAHGLPHFCVSIGLVVEGSPSVGVIYEPIRDWLFIARRGYGATLNGRRLRISKTTDLGRSLLATGFPYDRWTNPQNNSREAMYLLRRCQGLRRAGAAALDLAYVAAGWLDGYWEDRLHPWDFSAGVLLVQEAGGTVSHYEGVPLQMARRDLVATNGFTHDALLRAITAAGKSTAQD